MQLAGDADASDSYDFQTAWNSEGNQAALELAEQYFLCPSRHDRVDSTITSYVAITGPNCVIRDDSFAPRNFDLIDPDTIILVETQRNDIPWLSPEDLSFEKLNNDKDYAKAVIGGPHSNGGHFMTVDGRRGAVASIGIDQLLRRCVVELAASEPDE